MLFLALQILFCDSLNCHIYDVTAETWAVIANVPGYEPILSLFAMGDNIFGYSKLNALLRFDPENLAWVEEDTTSFNAIAPTLESTKIVVHEGETDICGEPAVIPDTREIIFCKNFVQGS